MPRPGPDNYGFAKFDMHGKTAYLQMTRFAPVDRFSTEALTRIMAQAAGSDAMIIDLRDGHGGEPAVSGPRYGSKRPLYILVNEDTASASESFAYALQQQKRAIVVGSKTAGGAHKQFGVPVTHHLIAFVAIGRSVDPLTRANWEGTGLHPDLDVPPQQALEAALADIAKAR